MQLLQKCQMGIEMLDAAEAKEAEWVAEREELQASLTAKEAMLVEEDLRDARGTNKRLLSQLNLAQGSLEMALRGKAVEIESVWARQEARLKKEFLAEHNSIMGEEVGKLTADYKAQLPGIRDRA